MKALLDKIVNTCYAAGATPKVYLTTPDEVTVALGSEWMYNADDSGNKYDLLIRKLNGMSTPELQVAPCGEVYGSNLNRIY